MICVFLFWKVNTHLENEFLLIPTASSKKLKIELHKLVREWISDFVFSDSSIAMETALLQCLFIKVVSLK